MPVSGAAKQTAALQASSTARILLGVRECPYAKAQLDTSENHSDVLYCPFSGEYKEARKDPLQIPSFLPQRTVHVHQH